MRFFRMMMYVFFVAPLLLMAREPEQPEQETLFSGDLEHGGYGCAVIKASPVYDRLQLFMGGYGGWFVNHTLMVGFGGYGMTSSLSAPETAPKLEGKTPFVGMGYGGLVLEYTLNSDKLIHFAGNLLVGAGGAGYSWSNLLIDTDANFNDTPSDSYFVAEFGAQVELNVASFFRMGVGGSYRFVNGLSLTGLTDKDLSGPSGNIILKLGQF